MNVYPIHTAVTHPESHVDEIWGVTMAKKWGEKFFPGIGKAKIEFDGTGGRTFEGINGDSFLKDGFLLFGIGGGMFDEHPGVGYEGKKGECTSTLVARYLGIENDPALRQIMEFVRNSDLKANCHPFDLASVTKAMYGQYSPEEVFDCMSKCLLAKYYQQVVFCEAEELVNNAPFVMVPGPYGEMIKIVTVQTDNREFHKAARRKGSAVVIQQNLSGNVQIFTDKRLELDIRDICQMVRLEEQQVRDDVKTTDWKELARPGTVAGADMWYFQEEAKNLYNGTTSHPDVEATRIPLSTIKEIVNIGMNPRAFEPSRQKDCLNDVCNSTLRNPCPWFPRGLRRCRTIRYNQKKS